MAPNDKKRHVWNEQEPQPIAVPLLGAHDHHNADVDRDDYNFVGRDGLIHELTTVLDETKESRGCYLIAGFRGAGKTSLINKVLALHAGKVRHPTWLPTIATDAGTSGKSPAISQIILCGRTKLESLRDKIAGKYHSLESPSTIPTRERIRRAFSPLIDVRVNLGHEKPLDSKEVLLNTASLLYQELRRQPTATTIARWSICGLFLVAAALIGAALREVFGPVIWDELSTATHPDGKTHSNNQIT